MKQEELDRFNEGNRLQQSITYIKSIESSFLSIIRNNKTDAQFEITIKEKFGDQNRMNKTIYSDKDKFIVNSAIEVFFDTLLDDLETKFDKL